jgi:hypothetical protein
MRVAILTTMAAFLAALVVLADAEKAQSRPVCDSDLTATIGPPPPDTFVETPRVRGKAARLCRSPARRSGGPTCHSGPFVTCRGTCSGGAEYFSGNVV